VIHGHHGLFGLETQLYGDIFDGIDRRAIDVGLAGLSEAPIMRRDTKALKQAFEGGRTTVHRGGLHNFRREKAQLQELMIEGHH
jgi:hypothetical protein